MCHSLKLSLDEISRSIYKIQKNTDSITKQEFLDDDRIYDSVILNLQIIGEASKNIPEEIRDRDPAIEWRKIIGLRNLISHAYFSLDLDIIWDIVQTKISPLKTAINEICSNETDRP